MPPGDAAAVADAILLILNDEPSRERPPRSTPVVEKLRWMSVVQPALNFLANPRLAPDAQEARGQLRYLLPLHAEWEQLHLEREHFLKEIEQFRNRRAVRWADRLASLLGKSKT